MGDWLGTGNIAPRLKVFKSFEEARKFVHSLKLKNISEWKKYCAGEMHDLPPNPIDIPTGVHGVYKNKGWKGMKDWLGNEFKSYEEALKFVHTLKLKKTSEWKKYCKGDMPELPPKPDDIPSSPSYLYKGKGWLSMKHWLGNDYKSYAEARIFVHALKLKSASEWNKYCAGEMADLPPKPNGIPSKVGDFYKGK